MQCSACALERACLASAGVSALLSMCFERALGTLAALSMCFWAGVLIMWKAGVCAVLSLCSCVGALIVWRVWC